MSVLTRAGIPLARSLGICRLQTSSDRLRRAIGAVSEEVGIGVALSRAFEAVGAPFTPVHYSTLRAAETGEGVLHVAFEGLSNWEERDYRLYQRMRSVVNYPLFLCGLSAIGLLLLIRFLVPLMASLAGQSNRPLPWPTRILLEVGQLVDRPVVLALGISVVAALALGARAVVGARPLRYLLSRYRLALPILGSLTRRALLVRFARVLQSLLGSGLPMTSSLELAAHACGNEYFQGVVIGEALHGVLAGERLSQALASTRLFPGAFLSMVDAGEVSGNLPALLGRIADLYEMEVETAINVLFRIAEPLLVGGVGLVIFLVLACAFLPMYDVIMAVSQG